MNIKIQDSKGKLTFLLQIDDKVTIIEGLSATGKSTLVRYIDLADTANIIIDSPIEIIHLNSKILGAGYRLSDKYLYILDEDDGIENEILTEIINSRKYNIILITRETVNSNLNYSIQQIYEFKTSGKINKLVKKYDNLNKKNININKLNKIVTEDSGSGFEFYKNYNNFDVKSSFGNSNICKSIEDNQVVVIDSLGFGPYIKYLSEIIRYKNIYLVYPYSFEWLLLNSIFRNKINKTVEDFKYTNTEEYLFRLLKKIMSEYNMNYEKGRLNKWFLEDTQFKKVNNKIKELFNLDLLELNRDLDRTTTNQSKLSWG